jgi:predicted permease
LKLRFFSDGGNALPTLAASLLKLVVSPLLVWGVGRSVGLSGDPLAVCVLQAAMPTAVLVTIFSVQYEAEPVFSNALVSLTTLASMGTIPALFFLLR